MASISLICLIIFTVTFAAMLVPHDRFQVLALVPYDYSYTMGCMPEAGAPQYRGGIIINPEFNNGVEGWAGVGNAELASARSPSGNNYAEISKILEVRSDGVSQFFNLDENNFYTVSAWFQASGGESVDVQAKIVTSTGNQTAGWITAKHGCWSMLKGGFFGNISQVVELRFETNSTGVDVWMDSISLQSFTKDEWTLHQVNSVDKVRKSRVRLLVAAENGTAVAHTAISIKQLQPHFPFGNVINGLILNNQAYQKWFLEKGFRYTTFENELKWHLNEVTPGVENYTEADAMLDFCKSNNLSVRGHNVLWDNANYQAEWVLNLTEDERRRAAMKRVESVVKRYKGDFIQWDVINENLHYDFFSNVTENGTQVFKSVHHLDPHPIPFLNEYGVVEGASIFGRASPQRYLQKIEKLRRLGYSGPLGIGLESHFDYTTPNIPYVRAAIDMLASTGLPIWITELSVNYTIPDQPKYLELLLHELHSHPAVKGIILWSAVYPDNKCYSNCLTDKYYKNLPSGDVVDKFMSEFITVRDINGRTDVDGRFEIDLFYGEYKATLTLRNGSTRSVFFKLLPGDRDVAIFEFKI